MASTSHSPVGPGLICLWLKLLKASQGSPLVFLTQHMGIFLQPVSLAPRTTESILTLSYAGKPTGVSEMLPPPGSPLEPPAWFGSQHYDKVSGFQ